MTDYQTLLILIPLSGGAAFELPISSAQGITQSLEPVTGPATLIRRDVSGTLRDLTNPQFRKYKATVSGNTHRSPAFDSGWVGQILTVQSATELSYATGGTPGRPEVSGSSYVEDGFTFYRPELIMMVRAFESTFDEYEARFTWKLELEEV